MLSSVQGSLSAAWRALTPAFAEATVGLGLGANVLLGGSNKSFASSRSASRVRSASISPPEVARLDLFAQ